MLEGRKILLGVSSSIAAYKAAHLVRLLIKQKAEVQVLMTPASHSFITPLTLSTLSKNPVLTTFESNQNGEWNNHVELGLWADLILMAPATANTIASMANGICNNLLLATYLSARCPVMFAPAMDLDMYAHPSTQQNINALLSRNNIFIEPENGELASGLSGVGRMAEPENIVSFIEKYFASKNDLLGYKVLLTAGPTYEYIDAVRFIGNASSGKMGYAIAETLANRGAEVTVISGPVNISTYHKNIKVEKVISAQQMFEVTQKYFANSDIAICSAAVADYSPSTTSSKKLKKQDTSLNIELKPTIDILDALGKLKTPKQLLVGFALETENELENAKGKLKRKNCDILVLNSLNDAGAGFNTDTNKITLLDKDNKVQVFPLKLKSEVAIDICNKIVEQLKLL